MREGVGIRVYLDHAGQEIRQGFTPATIGDVQDIHPGSQFERLAQHVSLRAKPRGSPAELARILFRVGHQFLYRVGGHGGMHRD